MGIARISLLTLLNLSLVLSIPTGARALSGQSSRESSRESSPAKLTAQKMDASCADMEADLIKMESAAFAPALSRQIEPRNLQDAFELLKSREFPDEEGVRLSAIAFHESFETVFPHYLPLGELDCPRLRLRLGRDLIASLSRSRKPTRDDKSLIEKSTGHEKSEIFVAIQAMLTEYKYPLPVEALSDALVLRDALSCGLIHATPDQLRELTLLTNDLFRDVHDFLDDAKSSIPGDWWGRVALILQAHQKTHPKNPNPAAQVEFLKSDSEVQKLKPALLKEIEASAKYLAHSRALILKLKANE